MTSRTLIKETLAAVLLASVIFAPGTVVSAQTSADPAKSAPQNPLPALPDGWKTEISVARDRVRNLKERLGI